MLSETPSLVAITAVAPGVRLSFFAILVTPTLDLAKDFINLISSLVQVRRMIDFDLVATNFPNLFVRKWASNISITISNSLIAAAFEMGVLLF